MSQQAVMDASAFAEIKDMMGDTFNGIITLCLQNFPEQLNDIENAIENRNAESLFHSSHKLKSACGSIGAYGLAEKAEAMLKMSLDALVNLDDDLAFKVLLLDDEVDDIKEKAYNLIKRAISENPDNVSYLINLLLISRHLERLADHATNIAEEVIYMIEGEIVRHGKKL